MIKTILIASIFFTSLINAEELSLSTQAKVTKYIDKLINNNLRAKRIKPNDFISDNLFLRRIYLAIIGRIPTLDEYDEFMAMKPITRRAKLIDKLFASPGHVSHSYNYWADALRIITLYKKKALHNYSFWLKKSIRDNKPYDKFVKELLTAESPISKSGHGAEGYYIRDYKMPLDNMSNTMQLFLGTSMVCAQCHDHPYKKWSQMNFYQLAAFTEGVYPNMSQLDVRLRALLRESNKKNIREGLLEKPSRVFFAGTYNSGTGKIKLPSDYSYDDGKPNEKVLAQVPFGQKITIDYSSPSKPEDSPFIFRDFQKRMGFAKNVNSRETFANWATSKENPMFTKTIVNRLWHRIYGVPLIDDLLDLKQKDLGKNPKLTEFLIKLMHKIDFDTQLFMKLIYNTKSYQSMAVLDEKEARSFKGPFAKRLSAEQIWDSLLTLKINEPDKILELPDSILENVVYDHLAKLDFKEMVSFSHNYWPEQKKILNSRSKENIQIRYYKSGDKRAADLRYPTQAGSTLQVFGASSRLLIDGSILDPNLTQALDLMNNKSHSFKNTVLSKNLKKVKTTEKKVSMIYKTILSREPTSHEKSILNQHLGKKFDPEIVYWSLINSHEFRIGM
ncbi:MAG: DUF1549 and DUF1553 domain-containing protein [Lentisphaeraceae bacterium]|nr:DUF1549 and DUF1553 domain-containing protein [Lentisphaeraceae bacterium]